MPHNNFVIQDTDTNLYCMGYNTMLENCSWGNGNWQKVLDYIPGANGKKKEE
jgi:hypothetical protein